MLSSASKEVLVRKASLQPVVYLLKNQQRRYEYRLLAAPEVKQMRDILPATL